MIEELPSILVTDGWPTDANDALVEVDIPSTVDTYQAPTKVKFLGDTITWVPSTAAVLQEFEAPNVTSIISNLFNGYTQLKSVVMNNLKSISCSGYTGGVFCNCYSLRTVIMPELEYLQSSDGAYGNNTSSGCFSNCVSLTNISFPSLKKITNGDGYGKACFMGCSALSSISMPLLNTIEDVSNGGGIFYGLTNLTEINFPSLVQVTSKGKTFGGCTGLTSVTFGSVGHPVTKLTNQIFANCTQSGLTITLYTKNGASLANSPWGATNATIVYETA